MTARRLIGLLVAINVALVITGWLIVPAATKRAGSGLRVGLVFDVGGKNRSPSDWPRLPGIRAALPEWRSASSRRSATKGLWNALEHDDWADESSRSSGRFPPQYG